MWLERDEAKAYLNKSRRRGPTAGRSRERPHGGGGQEESGRGGGSENDRVPTSQLKRGILVIYSERSNQILEGFSSSVELPL